MLVDGEADEVRVDSERNDSSGQLPCHCQDEDRSPSPELECPQTPPTTARLGCRHGNRECSPGD